MVNTSNEATPLRPQKERLINAPFVQMDLNKFIDEIKSETTWQRSDHNSMTTYKSEYITIVLMGMHENAELKTHTAGGDIMVQVIEGKINFKTEEQIAVMEKGQMIALQQNIPHSVLAVEESFFLLSVISAKTGK